MSQYVRLASVALAILLGSPGFALAQLSTLCDQGAGPVALERLVTTNPPPLWAPSVAQDSNLAALLKTEMTFAEVERLRAQGRWLSIGCGAGPVWISYGYRFTPYHPQLTIIFHYGHYGLEAGNRLDAIYGPDFVYYRDGDMFIAHNPPWWQSPAGYERKHYLP